MACGCKSTKKKTCLSCSPSPRELSAATEKLNIRLVEIANDFLGAYCTGDKSCQNREEVRLQRANLLKRATICTPEACNYIALLQTI